jgi:hypothetical protein
MAMELFDYCAPWTDDVYLEPAVDREVDHVVYVGCRGGILERDRPWVIVAELDVVAATGQQAVEVDAQSAIVVRHDPQPFSACVSLDREGRAVSKLVCSLCEALPDA